MKIDIAGSMVTAFRDGSDTYTPIFDGEELDVECGSAEVTLKNLARIVTPNRRVVSFMLAHGHVLIVFSTGESYLATGFSYGHDLDEVHRFAEFVAKHTGHDLEEVYGAVSGLPPDYAGPIQLPAAVRQDKRFSAAARKH